MSRLIALSLLCAIALTPPAIAQEYPGCFALDGQGNYIDLNYLCQPQPSESSPISSPRFESMEDSLYFSSYSKAYCEALGEGSSNIAAENIASEVAGRSIFSVGIPVGSLSDQVFLEVAKLTTGQTPCPNQP